MADISTVAGRINGSDIEIYDKATGTTVLAFRNAIGSLPVYSAADALTAHAGGGQASALQLAAIINRVTTVATIADSVKLPVATPGLEITVINAGANSMNVFPSTGDAINALGANTAFAMAATKVATFYCTVAGQWHSQLTA